MVIANTRAPYVQSFEAYVFAPWGTHDGLRLELRKRPSDVMVKVADGPKPMPTQPKPGEVLNEDFTWAQAKEEAARVRAMKAQDGSAIPQRTGRTP